MVGLVRIGFRIFDRFFTNDWHRQDGKTIGTQDAADLAYGFAIVRDVFKDVRGKYEIVSGIGKRQVLQVHFMINAFHAQVGGLVPAKPGAKEITKEIFRRKMKHRHT